MRFIIVFILSCSFAFAKEAKEATETVETVEEVATEVTSEKFWVAYGTFSYFDTWLPNKIGMTGVYGNEKRTYELAYQNASYSFDFVIDDLGKISDTRLHLTTRSHTWENSFNFQYGLYYNSLTIHLGNTYTSLVGVEADVLTLKRLGAMWGLGNRWFWKNGISFGIDYFKIFWPFLDMGGDTDYLDEASGEEQDDVQKLVDAVGSIPTFSLFHFELGYRF